MDKKVIFLTLTIISAVILCGAVAAEDPTIDLVTTGEDNNGGNGNSFAPSVSDDGNIIAFESKATDLGSVTTDGTHYQIYVYNNETGETKLVTTGTSGTGGNDNSYDPEVSCDGSVITFYSLATDLVSGGTTSGNMQIFAYDRTTGETTLITKGTTDGKGGNAGSSYPSISGDGSVITFYSRATDLVSGGTASGHAQIFAYDRTTGETTLITKGTTDGKGGNGNSYYPSISGDGSVIVFMSAATDLGPDSELAQIFAYDRTTGETTLITKGTTDGKGGNAGSNCPKISGDGSVITFFSQATDLVSGITTNGLTQIFAYDRTTSVTTLITKGSGIGGNTGSGSPEVSGNGNVITFYSEATNLGPTNNGNSQIFAYNMITGETTLITKGTNGIGGNAGSWDLDVNGDGSVITFYSEATDLISGRTTDEGSQVFVAYGEPVVDPDDETTSDDGTSNGTTSDQSADVNAASTTETIAMQETGAPLAGIILAILMLLGGFTATWRKH